MEAAQKVRENSLVENVVNAKAQLLALKVSLSEEDVEMETGEEWEEELV